MQYYKIQHHSIENLISDEEDDLVFLENDVLQFPA